MKKLALFIFALMTICCVQAQQIVPLTQEEFQTKVFDYKNESQWKYLGEKPCIIDFSTSWCGWCKKLHPHLVALAAEYPEIIIYSVDGDQARELVRLFQVSGYPTLVFCPMDNLPQIVPGYMTKEQLEQAIKAVLLR